MLTLFRRRASLGATGPRWITLDLETTGLDPKSDRIVEIGGVAITEGVIDLADSLHRVIADSGRPSAENRVVHGISAAEQTDGCALRDGLDALIAWRQSAPLVGFHTRFDVAFIGAALRRQGNMDAAQTFESDFIDLAVIAPAVFPDLPARGLRDWSRALGLPVRKQHRATADALATAHLLQRILARLPADERSFPALRALERSRRWL
ncbi:MAG: PolC-type DNA polymerase III [Casimicrobiaceae bacterium]